MFTRELHRQGHTQRFTIQEKGAEGWEVREERDSQVTRRVCYTDWHRVERALTTFSLRVTELEARGWAARD
jgi:hypothetical protein